MAVNVHSLSKCDASLGAAATKGILCQMEGLSGTGALVHAVKNTVVMVMRISTKPSGSTVERMKAGLVMLRHHRMKCWRTPELIISYCFRNPKSLKVLSLKGALRDTKSRRRSTNSEKQI